MCINTRNVGSRSTCGRLKSHRVGTRFCFWVSPTKNVLGRTDMRTHEWSDRQLTRTVWDISRDDRARIATCCLRTPTDIFNENYSVDETGLALCHRRFMYYHIVVCAIIVSYVNTMCSRVSSWRTSCVLQSQHCHDDGDARRDQSTTTRTVTSRSEANGCWHDGPTGDTFTSLPHSNKKSSLWSFSNNGICK